VAPTALADRSPPSKDRERGGRMSSQDMAHALQRLAAELEGLFDDQLWAERAEAGVDSDDATNPQRRIGCAIGDLRDAGHTLAASPAPPTEGL
jgi:hypothetical protein